MIDGGKTELESKQNWQTLPLKGEKIWNCLLFWLCSEDSLHMYGGNLTLDSEDLPKDSLECC